MHCCRMDSLARKLLEDSRLCSRGLSCKPPFLKSLSSFPSECGEAPEPMLCAACSCGSSMLGSRLAMVHGVMETVACAAVWPGHLLRPRASQPPTAQKQTFHFHRLADLGNSARLRPVSLRQAPRRRRLLPHSCQTIPRSNIVYLYCTATCSKTAAAQLETSRCINCGLMYESSLKLEACLSRRSAFAGTSGADQLLGPPAARERGVGRKWCELEVCYSATLSAAWTRVYATRLCTFMSCVIYE